MTTVFDRSDEMAAGPQMHAFVLGVGRFPKLDNAPNGDRAACVDSAKAALEFLLKRKDDFEVPLASIECLLSDPRVAPGQDILAQTDPVHDPRTDTKVGSGLSRPVEDACDAWMNRCREGDVLFFYCSSHGVAGRDETGLLVCEDYSSQANSPPRFLLNVASMAKSLPAACRASAVWIFMDACQEVLDELKDIQGGVSGIEPARVGVTQMVHWPVRSVSLVASRFTEVAYAPAQGGIAYFTEALLDGLDTCCVEADNGKWYVTARQVENTIAKLARVLHGRTIHTDRFSSPEPHHRLLSIDDPRIPIEISTVPERTMRDAQAVEIRSRGAAPVTVATKNGADSVWRCRLPLNDRQLEVSLISNAPPDLSKEFDLDPPSVQVKLP